MHGLLLFALHTTYFYIWHAHVVQKTRLLFRSMYLHAVCSLTTAIWRAHEMHELLLFGMHSL
jgi:hypothetical protein